MPRQEHAEHDDFDERDGLGDLGDLGDPLGLDPRFEDRLRGAFRGAGAGFEADPTVLAAAGEARGRRLLRRRRVAVVAGAAAVTCVAVGGTLLAPWNGDGGTGTTTASDTKTSSVTLPPAAKGADQVAAADMIRTLEDLLPEGRTSEPEGRGTDDEPPMPYAKVVFDDGKGAAAIAVSLNRVATDESGEPDDEQTAGIVDCPDKNLTPYDGCTTTRLSDGSRIKIFQGYEYPDRRVDTKWWAADLVTPQGFHVSVSEWNAPAEKDAPVSRPQPPLSTDQLETLVTAAAWREAAAAIPDPSKPGATPRHSPPQRPRISGSAVSKTLASLLPEGLHVTAKGGQESEYAYLVVDDGKGASMVQINVQPGMSDVEGQLFGSGFESLPDGTKVATKEGVGDDKGLGLVMRTADTIRPGGLRVVVSAFNSGSQLTPPTRDAPALTLAQLKAIATSAKWKELK